MSLSSRQKYSCYHLYNGTDHVEEYGSLILLIFRKQATWPSDRFLSITIKRSNGVRSHTHTHTHLPALSTYLPIHPHPSSLIPSVFSVALLQLNSTTPVHVPKRENPIINRLNKTKVERQVDHEQERQDRIRRENAAKRAAAAAKVCILSSRLTPSPSITIRTFFPFQLSSVFSGLLTERIIISRMLSWRPQ